MEFCRFSSGLCRPARRVVCYRDVFRFTVMLDKRLEIHLGVNTFRGSDGLVLEVLGLSSAGCWFKSRYHQRATAGPLSRD